MDWILPPANKLYPEGLDLRLNHSSPLLGLRLTHRGPVLGCLGGSLSHMMLGRQQCQGAASEESRSFELSHTMCRHLLGLEGDQKPRKEDQGLQSSDILLDHSHPVQGPSESAKTLNNHRKLTLASTKKCELCKILSQNCQTLLKSCHIVHSCCFKELTLG